ncbi:MAG: patatin-like phospholipase family protein [Bacteroidota bacterium]
MNKNTLFSTLCVFFICILATSSFAQNTDRPKIGLVLSGGAAKGIAHIGVLKVIDELGIPVDYVGGTSMGSIVGGLYAIGYTPEQMEDIILKQDWTSLLGDAITRRNMSVEEKEELSRYFVSFPIQNFNIMLPTGFRAGQNVSMLLSRLALPVQHINDFSNFPRPFLCVATDISTGKQVVLNSGYLPDAIRASMAIPTILTPIEIDGNLLVDGGLVNNFPAKEVKEMGADIIIGVNLGYQMHNKDELNSLANILEQSLFFQSIGHFNKNQELSDILITPELGDYGATSFKSAAKLIQLGEEAARKMSPQLKALAERMQDYDYSPPKELVFELDSLDIQELEIQGLEKVSKPFLMGKLRLSPPAKITVDNLEQAIERIYGTLFFDMVTYKLEPLDEGVKLIIRVKEKTTNLFRVGAHYDSDFNANLLLNTTFRNLLLKGTKLTMDFLLGENPRFHGEYLIHTGWKPRKTILISNAYRLGWLPDFGLNFESNKFEIFDYEEGKKIASYNYSEIRTGLFGRSSISNSVNFELGSHITSTTVRGEIITDDISIPADRNRYLNVYSELKVDNLDHPVYPHRGVKMQLRGEVIKDISNSSYTFDNIPRLSLRSRYATELSPLATLIFNYHFGITHSDSIPDEFNYFVGGFNQINYSNTVFPFAGLRFLEEVNQNAMVFGVDFQFEAFKNHFLIARGNVAKLEEDFVDMFDNSPVEVGFGFTYGYNSIIGPIEFSISKSINGNRPWITFINIGHWF